LTGRWANRRGIAGNFGGSNLFDLYHRRDAGRQACLGCPILGNDLRRWWDLIRHIDALEWAAPPSNEHGLDRYPVDCDDRHCAAVLAFLAGLERIGPTNAAMLSTLEPVVTVALGAVFLNETLRPATWIGGGLILVAVILLTRSELRRNQPQPQLEREPGAS